MRPCTANKSGISPVIAILIMVAITLVIAGVAAVWLFGFTNSSEDSEGSIYIFDVDLDGSEDEIRFSIVAGDILNTSKMRLLIDGNETSVPVETMKAGSSMTLDSGMEIIPGNYYEVKISVNDRLYFDNDIVASP